MGRGAETIETRTVTPGKGGTRVRKDMYELFRGALLAVIPRRAKGVAFRDLPRLVAARLKGRSFPAKGSVSWYITTVKLDLEARGMIERVPGVTPQHLRRLR